MWWHWKKKFLITYIIVSFKSWCRAHRGWHNDAERCSSDIKLYLCISNSAFFGVTNEQFRWIQYILTRIWSNIRQAKAELTKDFSSTTKIVKETIKYTLRRNPHWSIINLIHVSGPSELLSSISDAMTHTEAWSHLKVLQVSPSKECVLMVLILMI
jgi:hypothetical protein